MENEVEVELPEGELGEFTENPDGSVDFEDPTAPQAGSTDFLNNLVLTLPKDIVTAVADELIELIERDKKSREKRDKQYEEGLRRTGLGNDAPGGAEFEGASKVVHPVLAEACVDFSSRAIKELFPASGPVKPWVTGETTTQKLDKANRKTRYMNWQLTTQIEEYRGQLEQLLTQLPLGGSQYQKFWYDERLGRSCVEFVPIDEIYLPYSASGFYTAARVTHRQLLTKYEFRRRITSKLYEDIFYTDTHSAPESTASGSANDKIEGREEDGYNEDGVRAVLEIYCWQMLDGDDITKGESAPYIVTIDEDTEKVLSIYRNWKEGDDRLLKLDWFVEWKFIPWRGAYAIGLPHLIGGLAAALTGALRALLDSAHINNAATMLKLKAGRISGQNTEVSVTQVCEIEGPAGIDDIRKLAMPMPFNQPSPVLQTLMQDLYGLARGVVATAEDKIGQVGDRTPVGTTMALIEQGSNTYSAIHARLHESQKRALAILHRLNGTYLDQEEVIEDQGELTVRREDFLGTMDVIPVSDPTIFSEAQRFAQTQAIMQMAQQDAGNPNVPWNQVNVRRRALKQMRIENVDELLPPQKDPVTADILTENLQSLRGFPLKSAPEQDHMAHIQGHLVFISSPVQSQNPLVPPQALGALMGHIEEHIQEYTLVVTQQAAAQIMMQTGAPQVNDQVVAQAIGMAQQQLTQELGPVIQQIQQVQQALQQRTPPPPMPPEVQASIKIAEMDIQRKTQMDQATLQNKQAEQQANQQLEQATLAMKASQAQFQQQMEQSQQQFDNYIEQIKVQSEAEAKANKDQVELLKNEMDNHQKQMTELLKNRDDNETKIAIEQMSQQLNAMTEQAPQEPVDLTPHLEQMNQILSQMGKDRTNDALGEVMNGLRATIETLNKPKTIVRDAQGKAQGIQ